MTVISEVLSEARAAITIQNAIALTVLAGLGAAGAVWVVFSTGAML